MMKEGFDACVFHVPGDIINNDLKAHPGNVNRKQFSLPNYYKGKQNRTTVE